MGRRFIDDAIYDDDDDDDDNDNGSSDGDQSADASVESTNGAENGSRKRRRVPQLTSESNAAGLKEPASMVNKPIEIAVYRKEIRSENRAAEHATMVPVHLCQLLKTQQRNILVGTRDPSQTFENNLDYYSSLHADSVYGVKLIELANAFYPIRALTPTLLDVNTEPTVTGVPITFFAMIKNVGALMKIPLDQIYPLLASAYLPKHVAVTENTEWQSETHLNKTFDPENRRFPKERVIPVYLVPHFFALHRELKNHPHNNALLFGHRLIREMERRVPVKYRDACYMDCLRQLYANYDKLCYQYQAQALILHEMLPLLDRMQTMHDSMVSLCNTMGIHAERIQKNQKALAQPLAAASSNNGGTPIPSQRSLSSSRKRAIPKATTTTTAAAKPKLTEEHISWDDMELEPASTEAEKEEKEENEGEEEEEDLEPPTKKQRVLATIEKDAEEEEERSEFSLNLVDDDD
jgi:hypothetical protein